jgi:hypothetical protein
MDTEKLFQSPREKIDLLRIQRASTAIGTELEDEAVILDLAAGIYSGFDAVGTRIWQLLETEQTIAALRSVLCGEYEVSIEQCHHDLLSFLQDLAAKNLIEVSIGEG